MGFNCKYALFVSNRAKDSGRSHVFIAQDKLRVSGSVGASCSLLFYYEYVIVQ
jgi:hypothetical protein